jgi:hypothetical protein
MVNALALVLAVAAATGPPPAAAPPAGDSLRAVSPPGAGTLAPPAADTAHAETLLEAIDSHKSIFPPGPPPISARYLPPPGATYVTQEVRVRTAERNSLAGTLVLPWRPAPSGPLRVSFPAVVMITDGGPHNRDHTPEADFGGPAERAYRPFAQIADTLARLGIASLRLDDRGVGSSTGTLAGVDLLDLTYDVRAALEHLRGRPEIDGGRIAAVGIGEGALCAAMLARIDTSVTALVLIGSPADRGRDVAAWRARRGGGTEAEWAGRVAQDAAARFVDRYDPMETARTLRCPLLVLDGTAAADLPPGSAERLAAAARGAGNRQVMVREFAGLTRLLVPARVRDATAVTLPPEVLGEIASWLVQRLGRPKPAPAPLPALRKRGRR